VLHSNALLFAPPEVWKGGLSLTSRFESAASISGGTAIAGGEGGRDKKE
jgi:hypothetical protein